MTDLDYDGTQIVVLGHFNPSIFSPAWLRANQLIGAKEAEDAQVSVIAQPAAVFSVDWLRIEATSDRLQLATELAQESYRLRDAGVGVLSLLSHTPVSAVGLNRTAHWAATEYDQYME